MFGIVVMASKALEHIHSIGGNKRRVLPATFAKSTESRVQPYTVEESAVVNLAEKAAEKYERCDTCIFWQTHGLCLRCDIVDDQLSEMRRVAIAEGDSELADAAYKEMEKRSGLRTHPCTNYGDKLYCPFCGCDLPQVMCVECNHLYSTGRYEGPAPDSCGCCQMCGTVLNELM